MPALVSKWHEIRQLEDQNATLTRENQRKRARIEELRSSAEQQELEVRKQLRLLKPGETSFILPEAPAKTTETPATSTAQ